MTLLEIVLEHPWWSLLFLWAVCKGIEGIVEKWRA
jgi:hypothetical protein